MPRANIRTSALAGNWHITAPLHEFHHLHALLIPIGMNIAVVDEEHDTCM